MQTNVKPGALIWLDLEMTGLNPDINRILEIAVIVTDDNLNILAEGPMLAIHQDEKDLLLMDEWNTTHHHESGLVARVVKSLVNEAQAEKAVLDFVKKYVDPNQSPLCGNSIYQDRRFLARYMPELEAYCHYRNIDVSTVKELARRWAPDVYASVKKESKHLALDDIRESIAELRHYREHFIHGK
jgi:oligoribonuclease